METFPYSQNNSDCFFLRQCLHYPDFKENPKLDLDEEKNTTYRLKLDKAVQEHIGKCDENHLFLILNGYQTKEYADYQGFHPKMQGLLSPKLSNILIFHNELLINLEFYKGPFHCIKHRSGQRYSLPFCLALQLHKQLD